MTSFLQVLGIVGTILILVGLVGGSFTVSGSVMPRVKMPKVGNRVRFPCFSVGALMVLTAIVFGFGYNPPPPDHSPSPAPAAATDTTPPTSASPALAHATDPWNVVSAYFSYISTGDYTDAWNLLSPSMQSQGWGGDYSRFVSDFTPLGYHNASKISESGNSVTVAYTLHNTNTGSWMPKSETLTVNNGDRKSVV